MTDGQSKRERVLAAFRAEEEPADDASVPAAAINQMALAALEPAGEGRQEIAPGPLGASRSLLRLYGPAIEGHAAPVRLATRTLTVFQDVVSVFAMAITNRKSLFGTIPREIVTGTELRLSPTVRPGSVTFELRGPSPPDETGRLVGLTPGANLADASVADLLAILDIARGDEEQLQQELVRLGPRVASHLRRLSRLAVIDEVYLDLNWQQGDGQALRGMFEVDVATVLDNTITRRRMAVETHEFRGRLTTISVDEPVALKLADGRRIPMDVDDGLSPDLARYYNQDVAVLVDVEIQSHPTTGRNVSSYTLRAIHLEDEPISWVIDDDLDDPTFFR